MIIQDCCFRLPNGIRKACWVLTDTCNLACTFCAINSQRATAPSVSAISRKTCKQVVATCDAEGISKIVLSGGEPLLIPNVSAVVRALADNGISVSICTNGTLLTDSGIGLLRDSGLVKLTIGIDCLRIDCSSHGRQFRSATDDVLRVVENAKVDYEVSIVLLPSVIGALEVFAEWIERYHPVSISLVEPQACGRLAGASTVQMGQAEARMHFAEELAARISSIPVALVSPRCTSDDCPSQRQVLGIRPDGAFGECPWKRNLLVSDEITCEDSLALTGALSVLSSGVED